jgi:ribosomal protein S18 acetylase RimI-like enzyme
MNGEQQAVNDKTAIEYARRDELYEVAVFLDACWRAEYGKIVAADFLGDMSVEARHEKLLERFDNEQSRFLVLRAGDEMAGASVFGKSLMEGYEDDGEISAIYLRHDYIGKGYGHLLFSKIEQALSLAGYENIMLDVLSQNSRAVSFYEKHGYTRVADRFVKLGEKEYPLAVYRKSCKYLEKSKQ